MIRILNIIDNVSAGHKALRCEHGLSFHIRTPNRQIMFDFGQGENALSNARALGVWPDAVDFAVLSHSHYDHVGGYLKFVENGMRCPLITGDNFFDEKYLALENGACKFIGANFTAETLKRLGVKRSVCHVSVDLGDGVHAVSNFTRRNSFEKIPPAFLKLSDGDMIGDDFSDELCLVIEGDDGLCVIVGCSHVGVLNILESVCERFDKRVKTLIGGTHLDDAPEERISETVAKFKKLGLETIIPNHCSGDKIKSALEAEKSIKTLQLGPGACLFV